MHVAAMSLPRTIGQERSRRKPRMNRTLWVVQILLALFFGLASSVPKLFLPPEMLPPMPIPIPRALMIFIGLAELAGALGLILPGLTRTRPGLTPLAAAGLTLVCIGGAAYQAASGEIGNAVFAIVLGAICAFVGYGRWQIVAHRAKAPRPVLQLAR
jgi:putative oxidoreductase